MVGSIRRVCLTVLEPDHQDEIEWVRQRLAGHELVREDTGEIAAILAPTAATDWVQQRYLDPASEWASVSRWMALDLIMT